jgi:hypothetical protein
MNVIPANKREIRKKEVYTQLYWNNDVPEVTYGLKLMAYYGI